MSKLSLRPASPQSSPSTSAETRTTAWGLTGVLVLLYTVNYSDKILLGLVAQPLKEDLGLSSAQIGLVAGVFFFAFSAGGFFAGFINRRLALRWSLMVLAIIWAACMLPMVVAASFAVLLISRLVFGFTEGPSGALIHTAAYSWHPMEKRSLPGAFISAANSVAKIAVAPALAYMVARFGWQSSFVALAAVGLAWCVLWSFTWREGPYSEPARRRGGTAVSDSGSAEGSVPWMRIFRSRTFIGGLALVVPMYALLTVVLTWLPSYFEVGLGFTRLQAGAMFGFPSIAALVTMFGSAYLSDRFMSRGASSRVVRGMLPAIGLLLCGATMVLLPLIQAPITIVVVASVGYGLGCIVVPIMNAAISQICPRHQVAGALGVFLSLQAIDGIVAPPLTGMIVDGAETPAIGYAQSFQIFGVVAVVGALVAFVCINPARDAARIGASVQNPDA